MSPPIRVQGNMYAKAITEKQAHTLYLVCVEVSINGDIFFTIELFAPYSSGNREAISDSSIRSEFSPTSSLKLSELEDCC